jgi:PAS domain S-box-containing protein
MMCDELSSIVGVLSHSRIRMMAGYLRIMNLEEQNNLKIPSDAQNSSASDPPVPAFIGITERKRTEEALQQAHDELEARVAQRTEELWRANEQLRAEVAERQREEEKACDSQRLLQKIIDSSPSLIYLMDLEGRFLMSNQMFGQLFGISPHTLIGKGREIIVAKEFAEEHRNNDLEVIQTRKAISFEEDIMESDGLHTYSSKKFPLFDATGNVYAVCGISDDITELKRRERDREQTSHLLQLLNTPGDFLERISELTASLQKWSGCEAIGLRLRAGDDFPYYETRGFPSAFVQAENHLCACDSHGNLLRDGDGNPVLECMCGNVLCGRFDPVKPFFTAHGSFWSNNTTALLASTSEADRQARTRNRCNVEGYESVALIPLRFGGQVFGLIQFNDHRPDCFTPKSIEQFERMADKLAIGLSRRQAEEMLRRSEQEFRILAEAMPQIVWATRPDGWNIYFNKQWVDYTGLTMEESYGHGWIAPFHPDDRQRAWDAWQHSTQQDNPYALECRLRRFDGAYRWWLIRGVPLRKTLPVKS